MNTLFRHRVTPGTPRDRLDRYLAHTVPGISRSKVQRLILDGKVRVNGRPLRRPSYTVNPGEEISLEVPPPEPSDIQPQKMPLNILHEDAWLLVVDKPAGLVVHPGAGHSDGTLVNALLAHAGPKLSRMGGAVKPGLVHRLDKDTSGIMVVAKDDATHWDLSRQFAGRSVLRVYQAVVRGRMEHDQGTINAPIGRHPVQRKKRAVRHDSERDAVTQYKVIKRFKEATLVELYPQTGRTHQLRVHLASIGHPILGDTEYGVGGGPSAGLRAGFSRQALHAHRLGFVHPGIEQRVEFVSPLPRDLERQIARLS